MKQCYLCGIGEDKTFLYEGISKEGVVFVCRKCLAKQEIPLVTVKNVNPKESKKPSVKERLIALSGFKKKPIVENEIKEKKDENLNKLVEKNFKKNISEKNNFEDLIDNFHWIIMRARRSKKMTQEQFAKEIYEPLVVIEHLEKGILPKDYYALMRKVEGFLKINLFKNQNHNFDSSFILNESKVSSGLKISDLKKEYENIKSKDQTDLNPDNLSMQKIEEVVGKPLENEKSKEKKNFFRIRKKQKNPKFPKVDEKNKNNKKHRKDLTQKEIDKIIYQR